MLTLAWQSVTAPPVEFDWFEGSAFSTSVVDVSSSSPSSSSLELSRASSDLDSVHKSKIGLDIFTAYAEC